MATDIRLLLFALVLGGLWIGSDAVLRRSTWFWQAAQDHPASEQTIALRTEARLATAEPGALDVAIVGSSVADSDIDLPALKTALDRLAPSIDRFAMHAGVPLETAMMADLLVRLRPKILVYPLTLWSMQDEIDWDVVRFYDAGVAASVLTWSELARDHDEHFSGFLESAHVVLRHRDALRRTLGHALSGDGRGGQEAPPELLFAHVRERTERRLESERDDFVCPSVHVRALSYVARRLREVGTQMFVIATPVHSRWQQDQKLRRLMDSCLHEQASIEGFRYVPNDSVPKMSAADFRDSLHLSESGRARFTEVVTRTLAAPLHAIRARQKHEMDRRGHAVR